jgi:hypothetical protein
MTRGLQEFNLSGGPLKGSSRRRQKYLTDILNTSYVKEVYLVSPERLFNSVGLVKSDLWGNLLDTTLIDVMWVKSTLLSTIDR